MAGAKKRFKSRQRSRSRSLSRTKSARSPRRRTPTPHRRISVAWELANLGRMNCSGSNDMSCNMADEAARQLNCMGGALCKASSATSRYFLRQKNDSLYTYGLRLLIGLMLILSLLYIAKNQPISR